MLVSWGWGMGSVVLWLSSLPAVMGIVVFALGCYFSFRRHKKGMLKVKLPMVGELSTESLGIAFIVLAIAFLAVAQQVHVKERELAAAEEKARQAAERAREAAERARQAASIVAYARLMTPKERAPLLKSIASSMRNEIRSIGSSSGDESIAALDRMEAAAKLLLAIDSGNGHGTYFLGEAYRLRQASDSEVRSHGQFRLYVSLACKRSKASFSNRTDANACYDSADGYCSERIAWVLHLLANSHYQSALRGSGASREADMRTAFGDAEAALRIWGEPFVHPSKSAYRNTKVVRDSARAELTGTVAAAPLCP